MCVQPSIFLKLCVYFLIDVISNLAQQMILAIKKSKPLISDALNIPEVASDNMGAILLGILDNIEEHMSIKFWEKRLEPNLLEV